MCTRGIPTTCSSRILEGWRPPYDATVVRARARGGRDRRGQDEPRRIRDGVVDGELGVRPYAQPARPHAGTGGFERWFGGRGCGGIRTVGAGFRHRRLDPPARRTVRCGGREADVRSRVAVRAHRVRFVARPDRAVRGDGRRRGVAARSDRRPRSLRFHVDRAARARTPRRSRRGCLGIARGNRRRDDGDRRHRTRRARRGAGRGVGARGGGREGRHRLGSVVDVRNLCVLPDRAGGGVVEPGALRRRALRIARRRGRRCAHELRDSGSRFRRGSEAPDHARHVRVVGGLLRRVLRPGAAGAHVDPARLRTRLRAVRRADRVQHRRPLRSSSVRKPPTRWRCTSATSARFP